MPDQIYKTKVERDLRPSYYDKFQCLAQDCKISCCKNWRISFGKKDYLSLKRLNGSPELNEHMSKGICRIRQDADQNIAYGEFIMQSGVCPLLREDHLCELQIEKGHDALPEVCQTFPRSSNYMPSGYLERSLSLACEGVLKLLWEQPEGIDFYSDPVPDPLDRRFAFKDFLGLHAYYQDIRSWCVDMLQDRRYSLPERIMRMGAALKKLCDGERDVSLWRNEAELLAENPKPFLPDFSEREQMLQLFLSNNLQMLIKMSQDAPADEKPFFQALMSPFLLKMQVNQTVNLTFSTIPWAAAKKRFEENFGDREYFMENIMTALLFHLHFPEIHTAEAIWKSFVNFCNLYSFYRFMSVVSCREGSPADRDTLFQHIVFASRALLHNGKRQRSLRDEIFEHDSTTLAHMAVLLSA